MKVTLGVSSICSAFGQQVVGTRVVDVQGLYSFIEKALDGYDPSRDRVPGQHYIVLPKEAVSTVSCGVGRRSSDPADFVLRVNRGRVDAYLRRERAATADALAVVVYTHDAYNADPQVASEGRQVGAEITHVVVAVLASAGPRSTLSPYRFTSNLSGGNREAQEWSADEIRAKALEIVEYDQNWVVVAD